MHYVLLVAAILSAIQQVIPGKPTHPFGAVQNIEGSQNSRPNVVMQSVILGKKKPDFKGSSEEDGSSNYLMSKLTKILCPCESENEECECYENDRCSEDQYIDKLMKMINSIKRRKRKRKFHEVEDYADTPRVWPRRRPKKHHKIHDVEMLDDKMMKRLKRLEDYDDFEDELYHTNKRRQRKEFEDDYEDSNEQIKKYVKSSRIPHQRRTHFEEDSDEDLYDGYESRYDRGKKARKSRWTIPFQPQGNSCPFEREVCRGCPRLEKISNRGEQQARAKRTMTNKSVIKPSKKITEELPGDGKRPHTSTPQDILYIPSFKSSEFPSP